MFDPWQTIQGCNLIPFSAEVKYENGAYVEDGAVYFRGEKVIETSQISPYLENIIWKMFCSHFSGEIKRYLLMKPFKTVLTTFYGVEHRLQYVATIENRKFYNDSKATNILAASKALTSFSEPVILLAGGLDRGNEFDELKPSYEKCKSRDYFWRNG